MKERVFDNEIIIEIDNNGDNYEIFKKSVKYIKDSFEIEEENYYSGFFDDSFFHFKYQGVLIKVTFSGFLGTELRVSHSVSDDTKAIFKKLALDIINHLNSPRSA